MKESLRPPPSLLLLLSASFVQTHKILKKYRLCRTVQRISAAIGNDLGSSECLKKEHLGKGAVCCSNEYHQILEGNMFSPQNDA